MVGQFWQWYFHFSKNILPLINYLGINVIFFNNVKKITCYLYILFYLYENYKYSKILSDFLHEVFNFFYVTNLPYIFKIVTIFFILTIWLDFPYFLLINLVYFNPVLNKRSIVGKKPSKPLHFWRYWVAYINIL